MPAGKLTIEIDGDELKAIKAYTALNAEQKKLVTEVGKVGKASEDAANQSVAASKREQAERRKQVSTAQRLVKANETIEESYKREVQSLIKARKSGEISNDEYRKTIDRIKTAMRDQAVAAEDAAQRGTDAYRAQQKQVVTGEEKVRSLISATKTLDDRHIELKAAIDAAFKAGRIGANEHRTSLNELNKETARLKNEQASSFGSGAIGNVKAYAASF